MVAARALDNLGPTGLAEDAIGLDLIGFLNRHGDAHLLLVRIPEGDTELELGLATSAQSSGSERGSIAPAFPFRTGLQSAPQSLRRTGPPRREDPAGLETLLKEHTFFAVSVRKRSNSDAFPGRISVGRARNKDIVLRHPSVSKFHGWFEVDEDDALHVADAGSTNLTYVNGHAIEPRMRMAAGPGDSIRFGSVETVVCSARALWASLRSSKSAESSAVRQTR